jgi:hypothetical protein
MGPPPREAPRSDPLLLQEFLAHVGGREGLEANGFLPLLSVVYGEEDDENVEVWKGSPEGWRAFAREFKPEVYSWDLSLARVLRSGGSEMVAEAPTTKSFRVLRDYGWEDPRRNPGGTSPELILGQATRILARDPGRMQSFLDRLGIEVTLMVDYHSGEDQQWAGPPEDWPAMVRNYSITAGEIQSWDLILGKFLASDTSGVFRHRLEPYRESMRVLRRLGMRPPKEKRKRGRK